GARERKQASLALGSLRPDLREAGGDDAEGADTRGKRLGRRVEHAAAGYADHDEVHIFRHFGDRRVASDAGNGLAPAVHWIGGAGEVGREDVAEELAADRAAAFRGADNRDRAGGEERPQRRDDREVVALVDTCSETLGRGDRKANLDLAAVQRARDLEARVA